MSIPIKVSKSNVNENAPKYLEIQYSRYYKPLSNISPSWIEDAPKVLKMLEKNEF